MVGISKTIEDMLAPRLEAAALAIHQSKHGHLDVPRLSGWDAANGARARQNSNL